MYSMATPTATQHHHAKLPQRTRFLPIRKSIFDSSPISVYDPFLPVLFLVPPCVLIAKRLRSTQNHFRMNFLTQLIIHIVDRRAHKRVLAMHRYKLKFDFHFYLLFALFHQGFKHISFTRV
jgi:hypothetical protein